MFQHRIQFPIKVPSRKYLLKNMEVPIKIMGKSPLKQARKQTLIEVLTLADY